MESLLFLAFTLKNLSSGSLNMELPKTISAYEYQLGYTEMELSAANISLYTIRPLIAASSLIEPTPPTIQAKGLQLQLPDLTPRLHINDFVNTSFGRDHDPTVSLKIRHVERFGLEASVFFTMSI